MVVVSLTSDELNSLVLLKEIALKMYSVAGERPETMNLVCGGNNVQVGCSNSFLSIAL